MANGDSTAAQTDEQDFSIPGQDDNAGIRGGDTQGPPAAQASPTTTPSASAGPSGGGGIQVDTGEKVHPHMAILAGLLNKIISGVQSSPGNPRNAFDRGFMAQSPQAQQAQAAEAQKNLDEHQTNLLKMHTMQMQQALMAHQMTHLDDGHNQQIVSSLEQSTEFDRKEGLMQDEQEVDGEGMGAYSDAVKMVGQLNAKAGMGSKERYKVGITEGSDLAHLKFNVYKAKMDGTVTRPVFQGKDESGQPKYETMTGKYVDLDALEQGNRTQATQDAAKDFIKQMHSTLGNKQMPDLKPDADQRIAQLDQFIGLAGRTDPVWVKMAQDEKAAIQKNYAGMYENAGAKKKAEEKEGATGTLSLQEDAQGKPVTFNTKTGEVKPVTGVQKAGTFQKTMGGATDALNYASQYIDSKQYTGPGDEALMEKFFELAKPSTGFRMSQPQIDMLRNARSWLDSAEAKTRHATSGQWFSGDQRKQIADTMKALAKAKGISVGEGKKTEPAAGDTTDPFAQFGGKKR